MRKLLTFAIPLVLGVGVLTAFVSRPSPPRTSQHGVALAGQQPAVEDVTASPGATPTTAAPATTATTAQPTPKPSPTTTTTTTAPPKPKTAVVASARRPRPTTPATRPPAQPATPPAQPATIDCGTGSAFAHASLNKDGTVTATVDNEATKDIQIDQLVITADGVAYPVSSAAGAVVQAYPGQKIATFTVPGLTNPHNLGIGTFQFHTNGLPQCSSQSQPQ